MENKKTIEAIVNNLYERVQAQDKKIYVKYWEKENEKF